MRLKIFLFAIVAALATVFAADWTGSAVEPENMKKIDGKAFYVITSAEELAWFANQVNSGKTTINAVLNNDIVFGANVSSIGSYSWTPIGKNLNIVFDGIIDGNGKKIYGLYSSARDTAGFIGCLGANGVLKNVQFLKGSLSSNNVGGLVGLNKGNVINVQNESVSIVGEASSGKGAIVGSNVGTIKNCINKVSIDGSIVGGISGINSGLIEDCDNEGKITGFGYVGGICSKNTGTINRSVNKGRISVTIGVQTSYVKVSQTSAAGTYWTCPKKNFIESYAGGICSYNNGNIQNAQNFGLISTEGIAGGLVGYNLKVVQNSLNAASITLKNKSVETYSYFSDKTCHTKTITKNGNAGGLVGINTGSSAYLRHSYNSALVSSEGTKAGIVLENLSSASIINSYYDNTVLSGTSVVSKQSANVSNVYGKSTADMKKDQFAWILNTTNGAMENSGVWTRGTDGYPTFANEDSLAIRKVVFDDDGSTSNRYTNYKGLVTFPENPEAPEGLVFSGWYNSDDIKVKTTTVFTADQTVNAVYVDASDVFWTINFYNAAPADTVLESKSYQHGSIVTYGGAAPTLASTAQYTYTFKGWDVEPTNAVEDFDYHAIYDSTIRSYMVTFNNTDGSKIESATFEYGKMPNCTKTPTREATVEWKYSHKGWKPALDYVTEAATYMAIYDSSKVEYKVTFLNGTTVIDEQMVPYGDAAVAPANVTREGYKFVGWNTSFAKVTEALTVKALFEELIIRTVNVVDDNGDKIVDATVDDGEKYILPEAPKKEGYTFDAYYDGNKKLGVAGDEVSVTANITIIARYILRSYVITFNNYDGSKIESATFEYGKMPSCTKTPTRDATAEWAFSHKGWKPALNYVSEDAIYTAIYDSSKVKYKVTFVDGTTVIDEQMVPYGGSAVAPTNVTREGYKFVGWNASFTEVTETLTVMALFEKLIFRTVWVLDGFGGTIEKVKVEDGGKYTLPEAPKKDGYIDGYTFDAYYDGRKKLGVAGDEISVTANITITAKYIENPKSCSSQQEIASSSSTPRNDELSSSSFAKSSSSSKVKSSSSEKIEAIVATAIPQFSVMVNGRSLQISAVRIGATYALFDMQGKVLLQGRVQSANFEIPVARSGNYLIRVGNNVQRIAVK